MRPATRLVPLLVAVGLLLAPLTMAGPVPERVAGVNSGPWGAWYSENWYNAGQGGSSIAIDSQDRPHVFSMGPVVSYRYWDGSDWQEEVLGQWGLRGQFALDAFDVPHVAFSAGTTSSWAPPSGNVCIHGVRASSGWTYEEFGPPNCQEASITIDSDGRPHALLRTGLSPYVVTYAYKDQQGWHVETVEQKVAGALEVHIKPDGTVAASWWSTLLNTGQGPPRYAERSNGGTWALEFIASRGSWPTMAIAPDGTPHMAYKDETGLLIHAVKAPAGWVKTNVGNVIRDPIYKDITLDQGGMPHIVYEDGNYLSLRPLNNFWYATIGPDGLWHSEVIDTSHAYNGQLALDSQNRPHVVYMDGIADTHSDPSPVARTGYVTPVSAYASLVAQPVSNPDGAALSPRSIGP